MKTLLVRTAALLAFVFAPLISPALAASEPPPVNVVVRAEGEALAKGFEAAFKAIPNPPIYLTYTREDKGFVTLVGIRSVEAYGAVLIVTTDRGPAVALPARAIVVITNERPSTP